MFLTGTEFIVIRGLPLINPNTMSGKMHALIVTNAMRALVQIHMNLTRDYPA